MGEAAGKAISEAYKLVKSEEVKYINNYKYNNDY
jgi:hypothetical protein